MSRTTLHLARRWDRGTTPRVLALVAVLGLLMPTALRAIGPDGAAWIPGHGHIFLTAESAKHAHAHPWEQRAPVEDVTAGERPAATPGVLFTSSDSDAASSLAAFALPALALALAIAWAGDRIEAPRLVLADRRCTPPVPPPQG